jgi:hypothetical protein
MVFKEEMSVFLDSHIKILKMIKCFFVLIFFAASSCALKSHDNWKEEVEEISEIIEKLATVFEKGEKKFRMKIEECL